MVRPQGTLICNEINEDLHIQNKKLYSHLEELNKISCIPQTDIFQSQEVVHISQYNEMLKCTESDTRIEDEQKRCDDDPSLLYGYISAANYELSTTPANVAYKTMPLVLDKHSTNAVSEELSEKVPHSFEFQSDIRSKMCQLSVHPQTSQVLHLKEEIIRDVANDDCSVIKWRTPNLSEVISFLSNPNSEIQANAAAYLQHLCYMDDPNKQRTRTLGGILPLVRLLSSEIYDVHKNACGALRNLSYGRQNDENKRAIKNAGGVSALINLLCRTKNIELKELITGVIWNMSSCEDLKRFIIDDGLSAIVTKVIKPNSGWDPLRPSDVCYSTVFRNASGVLRNISSAGEYARTMLRNSDYLVQCLLHIIRMSIERNNIGTKIVENCVCVLRNLSYRCQEVEDPNYDKFTAPASTLSLTKGENKGCFGTSKKRKESIFCESKNSFSISSVTASNSLSRYVPNKELEQLWQPDVVNYYLTLLQSCSNPETLEAAAGAIQNLTACYWQPSIDIRAAVRKEKGLPILVELLRMEVDRVVCAVATALRNLAIDQRNKELIGKYAMRDLIQKLPSANTHDIGLSDETISAVLATINEVIKRTPEFARTLLDADGVERLMNISGQRQQYTSSVLKFADQVLLTMWQHNELRDVFKKHGWKEQDFTMKNFPVRSTAFNSSNNANSTLNRPMASQSHTRYEDKTIRRIPNNSENGRNNGNFPIVNEFPSTYHIKRQTNDIEIKKGDNTM